MFNSDEFAKAIIFLALVCVAIGAALAYALPWLWSVLKPLIHAVTA